jgi:hypothetical protein
MENQSNQQQLGRDDAIKKASDFSKSVGGVGKRKAVDRLSSRMRSCLLLRRS